MKTQKMPGELAGRVISGLRECMTQSGLSLAEIDRATAESEKVSYGRTRSALSGGGPTLRLLEAIARACGFRVVVTFEPMESPAEADLSEEGCDGDAEPL